SMTLQNDGKIIVSGSSRPNGSTTGNVALIRFNADGSLDTSFGTGGTVSQNLPGSTFGGGTPAVQSTGKIVVYGFMQGTAPGSAPQIAVVRFNSNGTLDTSFGTSGVTAVVFGGYNASGVAIQVLADDSIVFTGGASPVLGSTNQSFTDIALVK